MIEIKVIASGSKGNCYLVKNEDTTLLLECGIPYKKIQEALNFNTTSLDACLVTHEHRDHSKSVNNLLKAGVDVWLSVGTSKALKLNHHRVKNFRNDTYVYKVVTIGSFEIIPFKAIHDTAEPVNFYIRDLISDERLAFITDSAFCRFKLPGLNYLMIECNFVKSVLDSEVMNNDLNVHLRNRIVANHLSLETLLEFLKANNLSNLKKVYLLHLSDSNSNEEMIKDEVVKIVGDIVEVC